MADLKPTPSELLLEARRQIEEAREHAMRQFALDTQEQTTAALEAFATAVRAGRLLRNPGADGVDELIRKAVIAQVVDVVVPVQGYEPGDKLALLSVEGRVAVPSGGQISHLPLLTSSFRSSEYHSHGELIAGKKYRALIFFMQTEEESETAK